MDCGKPGGKPPEAELPPCEPMTVGEAFLSPFEDCQRADNGLFGGSPGKWPYSLLGGAIPPERGGAGKRIRSSFAEGVERGSGEGVGRE